MSKSLERLLKIMADLRDPATGCPWDIKQDFNSIANCAVEEAYEVVDAIESGDMAAVREELGDLLMQVVFHAQMGREKGLFDFDAIADRLSDKLVERHPHVFGEKAGGLKSSEAVLDAWEAGKAAKRAETSISPVSALDGIAAALPAMARSFKLQQRAGRVGFDWSDYRQVMDKLREEMAEVEAEATPRSGEDRDQDKVEDEVGDLLFVAIGLARSLKVDPETALRRANRKFERRFRHMETRLAAQEKRLADSSIEEMNALWDEAKGLEKNSR